MSSFHDTIKSTHSCTTQFATVIWKRQIKEYNVTRTPLFWIEETIITRKRLFLLHLYIDVTNRLSENRAVGELVCKRTSVSGHCSKWIIGSCTCSNRMLFQFHKTTTSLDFVEIHLSSLCIGHDNYRNTSMTDFAENGKNRFSRIFFTKIFVLITKLSSLYTHGL